MGRAELKRKRQMQLLRQVEADPFLKDEDLARRLGVSVATVRLDRSELGIAEYRERIKSVAAGNLHKDSAQGDLLDLNPYHDGISVLIPDESMAFPGTDIVRGEAVFAFAENLILGLLNAKTILIKVANVKYIKEVKKGEKLVAKFEVKRVRDGEFIVWVKIKVEMAEVFRGKFNVAVTAEAERKGT